MRVLDTRRRESSHSNEAAGPVRHAPIKLDPGGFPQRKTGQVPSIEPADLRELQRSALEQFHIDILQLTENAGQATSRLVLAMFGGRAKGQRIVVLAGGGSNGAAGLAAVRHLANWGFTVVPVLGEVVDEIAPVARRQAEILRSARIHDFGGEEDAAHVLERHLDHADLVIDALAGYGLSGPPVGIAAAATEMAVASRRPILALDVPTGVDPGTGSIHTPAIQAATTLFFDLPKRGLVTDASRRSVGAMYLADLGIPRAVYEAFGIDIAGTFSEGPLLRIRR